MDSRKSVNNISFAILTGGLSSRFGQNKLTFKIDNKSILDTVLDLVPPSFPVYIIGEKYTDRDILSFRDIRPGLGPIGGIYTALKRINSNYIFVLGGDMPFIKTALLEKMLSLVEYVDADVFVPVNNGFYEPLFAVYSRAIINFAEAQIIRKAYKISDLFNNLSIFDIDETIWGEYDRDGESFININTKGDLVKLNGFYKKCLDKAI